MVMLVVKNPPVTAEAVRDTGLIPGLGRSPGGGHGYPLQYSCLNNPMDRGAWWGYSPWGCKETDTTKLLSTHAPPSQNTYITLPLLLKAEQSL